MTSHTAREARVLQEKAHRPDLRQFNILVGLERPMRLPRFRGSMLRGVLGHGLLQLACDCPATTNRHEKDCLYSKIFEPRSEKPGMSTPPPPTILSSPWSDSDETPVDQLRVNITLVGIASDHAMLVLEALQAGLDMGLGEARVRASILAVDALTKPATETPITGLELLTPMLLKRKRHDGKVGGVLEPGCIDHREIFFALNRRIQQLHDVYQTSLQPLDQNLLEQACAATRSVGRFYPATLRRFSNRQRRQMTFDGVLGRMTLHEVPDFVVPLLHWGQWFHIGGKTALGMGYYRVIPAPRAETFAPVPMTLPGGGRK